MENRWSEFASLAVGGGSTSPALAEAVRGSRALGSNPDLVLHGGGNSSIKDTVTDITGRATEVVYVKGSGWDLATIEPAGFAGMRLDRLRELAEVDAISDPEMVNELRCALIDASAPDPSIESLLHALLPFRAVLHSHADSVVALTDQPEAERIAREVFGVDAVIVPYVMPGFDLAQSARRLFAEQASETTRAMVLLQHGLFTFGDTMEEAYGTHIALLTEAEEYLARAGAAGVARTSASVSAAEAGSLVSLPPLEAARLRADISAAAGRPMIVSHHTSERIGAFVHGPGFPSVSQRGTATPDHSIRTKPTPMIGTDVAAYAADYTAYFERNRARGEAKAGRAIEMLDPAPRAVLDPATGLYSVGATAKDADIVRDIALHTLDVIDAAESVGRFQPIGEADLFDIEYWDLEQAKLRQAGAPKPLAGQVALVTGSASGIGARCAEKLLELGAAVVGIDISADSESTFSGPAWLGIRADVTDRDAIEAALAAAVERFGGVDIVVVAAGVFAESAPLTATDRSVWDRTMNVNLNAVMTLFSLVQPFLAASPVAGRVVVIGSKNFAAPGPGAAAYSSSKAALTQLARVAALEWAPDGIRVNTVHPDAVFDTALWTDELLEERAAKYGLTIEEYKRRNLLTTTVTTVNVADMVGAMVTAPFASTTGAQVPVDGGNDRVI